jgi:uncharacterized protein (TIGR00369 family)
MEKHVTPPASSSEGLPREALEAAIQKTPFALLMGAKVTKYQAGKVELMVPVSEKLLQHHGFVHGAVIGFLADSACAWAAASLAGDVVTSEYKINLIAPALGTSLLGRGEVIKASGRQVVCRADVYAVRDGSEKMVATALATIARLKA